jgi:predicted phosphoribosyltransferase
MFPDRRVAGERLGERLREDDVGADLVWASRAGELPVARPVADADRAAENARERARRYRGSRAAPDLSGKRVVLVDDGVATGATVVAAVGLARDAGAEHVLVAVPVAAPDALDRIAEVADGILALETPAPFGAVGAHYRRFDQVGDEEARALLR